MWRVTENPPLASYYLALAAGIFGWSEIALHFAFLLPALAVILGTHRLARHFCQPTHAGGAGHFVHAGFSGFQPDSDVRRADAGVLGLGGGVLGGGDGTENILGNCSPPAG